MRYISTRGSAPAQSFSDILLGGLAADGGLFMPESYPQVADCLAEWRQLSYAELAFRIFGLFIDDIPSADLRDLCNKTYTAETYRWCRAQHDAREIVPLSTIEANFHLLELSNGPTLAFKDIAMQLLGNLFEYVLSKRNESINILGATSGDTGSAAEYAMRGKRGVRVFMLSPEGKMSAFQRAQMYSLTDKNIFNIAVRGMFDDAQDVVKLVSNDAVFKAKYKIGAVNSINWARVMAQLVYYFKGYFAATKSNDQLVDFCVPSGNFGNICAGHIARQMGLPISRLILATNENNVLDEFFRSGVYRPRTNAETSVTSSPSMDISKASNFERFVFDLVGRDSGIVKDLWQRLDSPTGDRCFDLNATRFMQRLPEFGFLSGCSTHAERLSTIRMLWSQHQILIDPHTADGINIALTVRNPDVPMVVLETAQAVKFEETILQAIGHKPLRPEELAGIENLPQRVRVMDADANQIKEFIAEKCQ
ncbi:MAG: threonine synthase [Rhodocyclaceae bacterium]|nr:threonine synthase [Rhodocyclaceae bacterium]